MHIRRDGSLFFFLIIICFIIILFYQHHYASDRSPQVMVFNPKIRPTNKFQSTANEHPAVGGDSSKEKNDIAFG